MGAFPRIERDRYAAGLLARGGRLAASSGDRLPRAGERVAFVGCGTSWFVGQALAALRESRGLGESDAFSASECRAGPTTA